MAQLRGQSLREYRLCRQRHIGLGDGYRFSDHPQYVRAFRSSLALIGNLGCGLLITPHPAASNLIDRLERKAPLIAPGQCRDYARRGRAALDERLAKEKQPSAGE